MTKEKNSKEKNLEKNFKEKNFNKEKKLFKKTDKANKEEVSKAKNISYKSSFNRLTKTIALLLFLTVVVVSYFSYIRYRIIAQRLENEVAISANQVEGVFVDYANISEMLLLHLNHQMIKGDILRINSRIAEVLTVFNEDTQVINSLGNNLITGAMFYWIDSKNYLIASSNGLVSKAINLSSRDYLVKTKDSPKKLQVGSPVIGAMSGQSIVPMALGVVNKEGSFSGTIVLSLRLDSFLHRFRNLKERNIEFAIADDKNQIIMSSSEELFRKNNQFLLNLNSNEQGNLLANYSLFNLSRPILFAKKVENQPYAIITAMRAKNAYSVIVKEMLPTVIEITLIIIFLIIIKMFYRIILFSTKK